LGNLGKLWIRTKREILCNYHRFFTGVSRFSMAFYGFLWLGWVDKQ
jgi:hypothetical protein